MRRRVKLEHVAEQNWQPQKRNGLCWRRDQRQQPHRGGWQPYAQKPFYDACEQENARDTGHQQGVKRWQKGTERQVGQTDPPGFNAQDHDDPVRTGLIDHIKQLQALHLARWALWQVVQNMDMVRCLELAKP